MSVINDSLKANNFNRLHLNGNCVKFFTVVAGWLGQEFNEKRIHIPKSIPNKNMHSFGTLLISKLNFFKQKKSSTSCGSLLFGSSEWQKRLSERDSVCV